MSWVSLFFKKTFGIPETHWDGAAKKVANSALNGWKREIYRALDHTAVQIKTLATGSAATETARELLHKAIESLNIPLYVKIIAGPMIDSIKIDPGNLSENVDREVERLKQRIAGARF